jgi:3-(3-hydroxy-phenyl)propionate hydroxylase
LAEEPEWGASYDAVGVHSLSRLDDGGMVRVLVTEQHIGGTGEPTLSDLSEALIAVYRTDLRDPDPIWISRFTDMIGSGCHDDIEMPSQ